MVQRLPQRIGQNTNEDVRFDAAAVLMPNRTEQQMALQDPKRMLDHSQLHVGFPEFRSGPAGLIAPQQIDAIPSEGGPKLVLVPAHVQLHLGRLADGEGDEGSRLGILPLQAADPFQDLVPALQPARGYRVLESPQRPRQRPALPPSDRALLLPPRSTPCQQVDNLPTLDRLDDDVFVPLQGLPAAAAEVVVKACQFASSGRQQVLALGLAQE